MVIKKAFINVGGDEVNPVNGDLRVDAGHSYLPPRDKPDAVQNPRDYPCLGWNKDGTEA